MDQRPKTKDQGSRIKDQGRDVSCLRIIISPTDDLFDPVCNKIVEIFGCRFRCQCSPLHYDYSPDDIVGAFENTPDMVPGRVDVMLAVAPAIPWYGSSTTQKLIL
jgi:hypothetical protein